MQAKARNEGLQVLLPKLNAKPRVYYRGLERWDTCFIGGSVSASVDGVVDCIAGAEISLFQGTKSIAVTSSDAFGDFRFGGLDKKSGSYRIEVRHSLGVAQRECELDESIYLAEIQLVTGQQHCTG
jgi:hypothetical protein